MGEASQASGRVADPRCRAAGRGAAGVAVDVEAGQTGGSAGRGGARVLRGQGKPNLRFVEMFARRIERQHPVQPQIAQATPFDADL